MSDQTICAAFERIESVCGDTSLTYFEFGTLAALLIMDQAELDIVVLEVGLGGRLDAVNLIDADIAIVTSLALDHQDWLGDDLNQIAAEKAAISRSGRPLIYGDVTPVPGLLVAAGEIGAQLWLNGRDFSLSEVNEASNTSLPQNSVACAVQAVKLLDLRIADTIIEQGLQAVNLLGRFQQIDLEGVRLILDVAHNPQATELLAQRLRTQKLSSVDQKIIAVCGVMADKDIPAMFLPLVPLVKDWFFCDIPGQPRAAGAGKLSTLLYNVNDSNEVNVVERTSPVAALQAALANANIGDSVVVFGSFFTVGPVLEWLNQTQKGSVSGE
ncbi:MAG TPA: bifunctional tetrahydrofolate synthase/dihydrofolate synthase [Porticoccus sp.]|nr:bifunctional tetrahydrofolate synthase/dihydrofolate synthase [Porticoccus sp.]